MNYVTEQKSLVRPGIGWFVARLTDRTMRGIAIGISAMIRSGELPVGTPLPPVRELAWALGVSPATVSTAWKELRQYRVISGRGRTGMWVSGDQMTLRPMRFTQTGNLGAGAMDLTMAVPDPALLPPLVEALTIGAQAEHLNSYQRTPILRSLEEAVRPDWPYDAEAFIATNGGYEAIHAVLQALVMPGSVLAVEDPTALRLLDIVDHAKAHVIPIRSDAEGPVASDLAAALEKKPSAFLYQPRTHAVTGIGTSMQRMRDLAQLLRNCDVLIIEDDGVGDISSRPAVSLGKKLPLQTIHIRSYSKSLGPDMRLGVLSGSQKNVERIQAYRSFGAGWTSRILQAAAAWLILDPATGTAIDRARTTYSSRRRSLIEAARKRGLKLADEDGLSVWVPVNSEQYAQLTLAARRIAVLPGRMFSAAPGEHIRIATSLLSHDVDILADALALVMPDGRPSASNGGKFEY